MLLEIITPEKKVFQGEVNSVQFAGTNGKFEVLNNHAPIISTLTNGYIRVIYDNNKTELFEIDGGVIEMQNNKIIVLAASEINPIFLPYLMQSSIEDNSKFLVCLLSKWNFISSIAVFILDFIRKRLAERIFSTINSEQEFI